MSRNSSIIQEAPALVALLERAFGIGCVHQVSADYERASRAGGNVEPNGLVREEGVSFRPRLARIVTLLLKEVPGVRLETVREAICAAGGVKHPGPGLGDAEADIDKPSATPCSEVATRIDPSAASLAIELDTIRHLHMTPLDAEARARALSTAEELAHGVVCLPALATLRQKLLHAITLQRRGLGVGEEASGDSEES